MRFTAFRLTFCEALAVVTTSLSEIQDVFFTLVRRFSRTIIDFITIFFWDFQLLFKLLVATVLVASNFEDVFIEVKPSRYSNFQRCQRHFGGFRLLINCLEFF